MDKIKGNQANSAVDNVTNDLDTYIESEYSFDDYYIAFHLSGKNKTDSYLMAIEAYQCEAPLNPTQAAYTLHKRLDRDGLITKGLQRMVQSDAIKGRLKLLNLLNADSEAVQLASAKHVTGTLYSSESSAQGIQVTVNRNSTTIKHGQDTLTVENSNTIKDIE